MTAGGGQVRRSTRRTRAPRPPASGARCGRIRAAGRTWVALALVVLVSGAAFTGRDGWRPGTADHEVPTATLRAASQGGDAARDPAPPTDAEPPTPAPAPAPALALATTEPPAPPDTPPRRAVANPVSLLDAPDPAVLRTADGYLAFSTQSRGQHLPVLASRDLATWSEVGDALPALPAWSRPGQVWAPDVWRHGDRHVLYYSTLDAGGMRCVSAAESVAPAGPYLDRSSGPLVCQHDRGGSIDPSPFRDADGRPYLFWKSEGIPGVEPTRVWVAPLAGDGLALAGEPHEVLQQDRPWETPILEGPDMVLVDGEYHLFYSANRWETADYAIGHAVCASVRGPCEKTTTGPWLAGQGDALGPGGPDVFTDVDGHHWLAYHAWAADSVGYPHGARRLHLRPLSFVGDGPGPTRALLHAAAGHP